MNIKVTGRHINVTDNIREYAQKKLEKLEAYFNQLIDCHIILYLEKLDRVVEVVYNGDGVQFHGRRRARPFRGHRPPPGEDGQADNKIQGEEPVPQGREKRDSGFADIRVL